MKSNFKLIGVIVLSVAVGGVGSYFAFRGEPFEDVEVETAIPGTKVIKTAANGFCKKVTEISLVDKNGKKSVKIVETRQKRPGSDASRADESKESAEDADEENLTELQKAVLKELQDALDNNNLKQVRKALSKFVAKVENGGLGGQVPVCMRAKAVEALGWFGKKTAVDLLEYVADANEEVASEAFTHFEQALSDCEMGDKERSKILTAALTAITDDDQVDSLLNQLNDMRNSVKAQSVSAILSSGSDTAKAKMREQMEIYLDEEVGDLNSVEKWEAMNPDDPSDDETYGGSESEDAPDDSQEKK